MLKFCTDKPTPSFELNRAGMSRRSDYFSAQPIALKALPITKPDVLPLLRRRRLRLIELSTDLISPHSLDALPYPVMCLIFKHLSQNARDYLALASTCKSLFLAITKGVLIHKKQEYFPFLQAIHEHTVYYFLHRILEKRGMDQSEFLKELNPAAPWDLEANRLLLVHLSKKDVEQGIVFIRKRQYLEGILQKRSNRENVVYDKFCSLLFCGLISLGCAVIITGVFMIDKMFIKNPPQLKSNSRSLSIKTALLFTCASAMLSCLLALFAISKLDKCLPSRLLKKVSARNLIAHQSKNPFLLFRQPSKDAQIEDETEESLFLDV